MSHACWCILTIGVLASPIRSASQTPQANKTYSNPDLHLILQYPADLSLEDGRVGSDHSYRTRFALHPADDPERMGADPCSPLIMAIGMGPDRKRGNPALTTFPHLPHPPAPVK
jgi:hypothetical protein